MHILIISFILSLLTMYLFYKKPEARKRLDESKTEQMLFTLAFSSCLMIYVIITNLAFKLIYKLFI
jgi:hypothetical protein